MQFKADLPTDSALQTREKIARRTARIARWTAEADSAEPSWSGALE